MRLVIIYTKITAISLAAWDNKTDKFYLTINIIFYCWKSASALPMLTEKRTSTSIPINKDCHNKNQS